MRLDDYLQRENGWPDLIIAGSARNCGGTSRNKRAVRRKEKKEKNKSRNPEGSFDAWREKIKASNAALVA